MQCTFLAVLHLILLKPDTVGTFVYFLLTVEETDTRRLHNFLQITQLVRDRMGFGILTPENHNLGLNTDIPWAEGRRMRLGVSWILNPYSLLTIYVSLGE